MKGSRTPGEGPSHPGDSTVPLHSTAWANWPEEGGPREGRPSLAPARTFSPSTTSNSTVSPSPTLRRNFLGLFLLMAVWQRKGHEKGEGSRPGVSLTPAGSATPFPSVHHPSRVQLGRRAERGGRPSSVGEKPQTRGKPEASQRPCPQHCPWDTLPPPFSPQGFPKGRPEAGTQSITRGRHRPKLQSGQSALCFLPESSRPQRGGSQAVAASITWRTFQTGGSPSPKT